MHVIMSRKTEKRSFSLCATQLYEEAVILGTQYLFLKTIVHTCLYGTLHLCVKHRYVQSI